MKPSDIYFFNSETLQDEEFYLDFSIDPSEDCCAFDHLTINGRSSDFLLYAEDVFSAAMLDLERITTAAATSLEKKLIELYDSCPFVVGKYKGRNKLGKYDVYLYILDPNALKDV